MEVCLNDEQKKYIDLLTKDPIRVAKWLGFTDMTELHREWIIDMAFGTEDSTLLAHRNSYKTTALDLAMAIVMVLLPDKSTLFMRKTDTDVTEIIKQTENILLSETMQHIAGKIYDSPLKIIKSNASEITTNLVNRTSGTVQLLGVGKGGSITGKHFDIIRTDDIVNLKDRISRAERENTKQVYMELQNIKKRGGRITNTATPWHKEDTVSTLMPNVTKYDCYSTGLMNRGEIEAIRDSMTPSLFAANYELKHIASENALFSTNPKFSDDDSMLFDGIAHIDAAYGGEDGSALTLIKQRGDKIYVLGKLRKMHIDKCLDEYLLIKERYRCGSVNVEENADKGYLAKEIRNKGDKASGYHESMNKYIKISTYLVKWWKYIVFMEDTDPEYINEIMDYTEDAEHDDSPDSLASIIRKIDKNPGYRSIRGQLRNR